MLLIVVHSTTINSMIIYMIKIKIQALMKRYLDLSSIVERDNSRKERLQPIIDRLHDEINKYYSKTKVYKIPIKIVTYGTVTFESHSLREAKRLIKENIVQDPNGHTNFRKLHYKKNKEKIIL